MDYKEKEIEDANTRLLDETSGIQAMVSTFLENNSTGISALIDKGVLKSSAITVTQLGDLITNSLNKLRTDVIGIYDNNNAVNDYPSLRSALDDDIKLVDALKEAKKGVDYWVTNPNATDDSNFSSAFEGIEENKVEIEKLTGYLFPISP